MVIRDWSFFIITQSEIGGRRWTALFPWNNFQIFSFSSSGCFMFRTTQCKIVYLMEFLFIKLQPYTVQTATILSTDFNAYTFWSIFRKTAQKEYFEKKVYGIPTFKSGQCQVIQLINGVGQSFIFHAVIPLIYQLN